MKHVSLDLKDYGITMWEEDKIISFRKTLLAWYDREKRDLPWRHSKNPYHIWVSEIMLQQTQVITVIPYYHRFLDWFPTVKDLAQAPEEKLLKAWEGLGYYSRVRNMQTAARQIMTDFHGEFPSTHKAISQLKGIGPYTAGAIASIAFDLPEPAVDGNVMRVMARLFEIDYDIGDPKNRKIFQAVMEVLIDPKRPGDFNQALMDLGSDIDSAKNPRPDENPIRFFSSAYLNGTIEKYPVKLPKKKPKQLFMCATILQNNEGQYLLEKNNDQGLLAGFWSFPLIEIASPSEAIDLFDDITVESSSKPSLSEVKSYVEKQYHLTIDWNEVTYSPVKHVFSHRKWDITLLTGYVSESTSLSPHLHWASPETFSDYPFATPQKKIWETFLNTKK